MDFARPPVLERRRTDLLASISGAVSLVKGRCCSQEIELTTNFPAKSCEFDHDPTQIKQVILNLLLNALDALQPQGHLRVSVRERFTDPSGSDSRKLAGILIDVVDNGPGIPPESLEKIFEPFATTKESGTGLGLAICRRIVEAHDGSITVTNVAGTGTGAGAAFSIWLPQRAAA